MDLVPMATSADVAATDAQVAVLPVGSFEQHGAYLPLATDTIVACTIASALAEVYPLLVLPPITLSCSHEHAAWPGTISLSAATMIAIVADVRSSLHHVGIDRLVLVNGHGGNYVLGNVVQEATLAGPSMALFPGRDDWTRARRDAGLTSSGHDDMHAGEMEASLLLHACPEVVRAGIADADHDAPDRPYMLTLGLRAYAESGVVGRPSLGTAAKGKAVLDSLVAAFRDLLRLLK